MLSGAEIQRGENERVVSMAIRIVCGVAEDGHQEIRRRTKVIGIFPNTEAYVRLTSIYLLEYSEDRFDSRVNLSPGSLKPIMLKAA